MAHVDYEAAWIELADRLRAKPGWGAKELHELMVEVAAEHRVPENFAQKIVRLYGDTVHLSITTPETATAVLDESELTAESKPAGPEASTAERSHDERQAGGAGSESRTGRERDAPRTGRDGEGDRPAARPLTV